MTRRSAFITGSMILMTAFDAMPARSLAGTHDADSFELVLQDQKRRIETIARAAPSVVCIYDTQHGGAGSGVLIDDHGHGLTNFHVVAGMLKTRRGWAGLSNGQLYEMEVLGVDPTGDVAMFKLIGDEPFAFAPLGDSEKVRVGDTAIAAGNPFSLSEDHSATFSLGMVTGVHRYQWGVGNNLIYSDCIQVDSSINPGNSGGPLFNRDGEIIGINGRISVNTRGRYNVGFGYAISSNQIKRFIPSLRAGLLARHGTLAATVAQDRGVMFVEVAPGAAADRAGIRRGDTLLSIDGVAITSPNQFVSIMGTYPSDREVALAIERNNHRMVKMARLDPMEPDLREPYEPNRDANTRQIRRVVAEQQRAAFGRGSSRPQTGYRYHVDRKQRSITGRTPSIESYTVEVPSDGPIRMVRLLEDGSTGKIIEFDRSKATQRPSMDRQASPLGPLEEAIHIALYVWHRNLRVDVDALDLEGVEHLGGGAFYRRSRDEWIGPQEVETISWRINEHAVAKYAFHIQTKLLHRIDLLDNLSGDEMTVLLDDYRNVGGAMWPHEITLRGGGFNHRDTLSHWEVNP